MADHANSQAAIAAKGGKTPFHVELIKPSHYDDDGYVIQWRKAWIPSNSLASLYGQTLQAGADRVLGEGVEIEVRAYDETNTVIKVASTPSCGRPSPAVLNPCITILV